jgi:spoIIIJ-associated protein
MMDNQDVNQNQIIDEAKTVEDAIEKGLERLAITRDEADIDGADGLLIGKKGQNLEALEHLLRRMVGKQLRRSVRLEVDIGGYRERRVTALESKATSMASRVKSSGKEMQVEPLSAAERRIVHLALVGDPQVKTYTVGDGDLKSVVIAPQRRSARATEAAEQQID